MSTKKNRKERGRKSGQDARKVATSFRKKCRKLKQIGREQERKKVREKGAARSVRGGVPGSSSNGGKYGQGGKKKSVLPAHHKGGRVSTKLRLRKMGSLLGCAVEKKKRGSPGRGEEKREKKLISNLKYRKKKSHFFHLAGGRKSVKRP